METSTTSTPHPREANPTASFMGTCEAHVLFGRITAAPEAVGGWECKGNPTLRLLGAATLCAACWCIPPALLGPSPSLGSLSAVSSAPIVVG